MSSAAVSDPRWHLYRLLADPVRLRVLALSREAELSVGELAEVLEQTQPNVSRHTAPLRQAGLVSDRRDGTRTLLRLATGASSDPVVADALAEGRRLCEAEGSLTRVAELIRARDARSREYFASEHIDAEPESGDLAAYLFALGAVIPRQGLLVDAGTGDGTVLEAVAPFFERVIAVDRSEARLGRARRRTAARGYDNVEFIAGEIDSEALRRRAVGAADLVVAGRMLHHAPVPIRTVGALAELLAPGGRLLIVDYASHTNEAMRDAQADVWLGFEPRELVAFATDAGLVGAKVLEIPTGFWAASRRGRAERVPWLALTATKPKISGDERKKAP
ncbi:MAG TPA: metalloregulator ArsR/SmtB family transcription factor [Polyangiaceae bacterium]|jgi:ArsR family transcriptional regulator|nr:metalloregulator ArsR/SmtB family transcription factor [Polyangiaceae bacterium]